MATKETIVIRQGTPEASNIADHIKAIAHGLGVKSLAWRDVVPLLKQRGVTTTTVRTTPAETPGSCGAPEENADKRQRDARKHRAAAESLSTQRFLDRVSVLKKAGLAHDAAARQAHAERLSEDNAK